VPSSPRLTASAVALVLLLAACGGAGDDGSDDPGAGEPAAEEPAAAPAEDDVRTVAHDLGDSEVPADPERVVVLDSPHLDAALALGVTPVGSVEAAPGAGLPAYLGDATDGIELVGSIEEPDLEAIAALEPDLILTATVRHETIADQLGQLAPTVFTEGSGTDWTSGFALVAEALGRADEGDAALARYEERTEEVGEAVDAEGRDAAIVRFLPGETRVYGPDTFSGSVLSDVGFDLPDEDYDEYSMAYLSAEQIGRLDDAEVIFATSYGEVEETTRGEVETLWGSLPAVTEGRQYDVEDDEWMIGIGLLGAEVILDDVEALLAEG
jgi:iron complex transport system substrate-binding protein